MTPFEAAQKAVQKSLAVTRSVQERSKKLSRPSPQADKIGTALGSGLGIGLILAGTVQVGTESPVWGLGTITAGAVTIVSNQYHRKKSSK